MQCSICSIWGSQKKQEKISKKMLQDKARYINYIKNGKWFEPRSLSRLCGLIVLVRVVPRRTVVGDIDRRFDNLSGSHHQSHVNCVSSVPCNCNRNCVSIHNSHDSDDDFRSGCRNVAQCHQQQSFLGLLSPGRSNHTNDLLYYLKVFIIAKNLKEGL